VSSALQFSSRSAREKAFIVVWPGDDIVYLEFHGETVCAPPTDVVAEAGKGRWRFGSARDQSGRPVPGTVLISDRYVDGPEGVRKSFDSEWFLFGDGKPGRGLIGVNEPLVARGLMVVDDVSMVEAAKKVGRAMWEERQAKADDELIYQELTKRKNHEAKYPGAPVPMSSDEQEVKAAVERQKQRAYRNRSSVSTNDLIQALGGVGAPSVAVAPAPSVAAPAPGIDAIADRLFEAAESNNITLTKPHLKALLGKDPAGMEEVRALLQEKGVSLE
jgi:hypothetical protein